MLPRRTTYVSQLHEPAIFRAGGISDRNLQHGSHGNSAAQDDGDRDCDETPTVWITIVHAVDGGWGIDDTTLEPESAVA